MCRLIGLTLARRRRTRSRWGTGGWTGSRSARPALRAVVDELVDPHGLPVERVGVGGLRGLDLDRPVLGLAGVAGVRDEDARRRAADPQAGVDGLDRARRGLVQLEVLGARPGPEVRDEVRLVPHLEGHCRTSSIPYRSIQCRTVAATSSTQRAMSLGGLQCAFHQNRVSVCVASSRGMKPSSTNGRAPASRIASNTLSTYANV